MGSLAEISYGVKAVKVWFLGRKSSKEEGLSPSNGRSGGGDGTDMLHSVEPRSKFDSFLIGSKSGTIWIG